MGLIIAAVMYVFGAAILYEIIHSAVRRGTREALRDHELWRRGQE